MLSSGNVSNNILTTGTVSTSGNVYGTYLHGCGANLIGGYSNTSVTNLLSSGTISNNILTTGTISTSGNVYGTFLHGDGSNITGVTSTYGNANVILLGQSGNWSGNIIPSSNNVYSLGNLTNQWKELYVSNNTIWINGVPLSSNITGNTPSLFYNNAPIVTSGPCAAPLTTSISTSANISASTLIGNAANIGSISIASNNISVPGYVSAAGNVYGNNIRASYIYGCGANITGIGSFYGNADVAAYLPTYAGNIGSINSAGYIFGNGYYLNNVYASAATAVIGNNQPNITSVGVLNTLSVFGTTTTWDLGAGGAVSAGGNIATTGYFIGDGSMLTNVNSGSGSLSRTTVTSTTGMLTPNSSTNITIAGFKGYNLYGIQTSAPAAVTVYTSVATRVADASRPLSVNPTPGTGVLAEVITTSPSIQYFTPGVVGFSTETPPSTNIQLKVINTGIIATPIAVTLILVKTEN